MMKTEGAVAKRAREHAQVLLVAVLVFMAVVSLWTPVSFARIAARWFSTPNIYFLWPVPLVTTLLAFYAWRWLQSGREVLPFFATIGLFLLGFLGLVISSYPYLVPPSLTIWDTAAAPASQMFMLIGTLVLLPLILVYTGFVYWLFRGKVRPGEVPLSTRIAEPLLLLLLRAPLGLLLWFRRRRLLWRWQRCLEFWLCQRLRLRLDLGLRLGLH
jgi:cytochrome d ubiquinol oxidase subunit II